MSEPQEKGKKLENTVENVYSILLQNEHLKNSKIEKNHFEIGRSGAQHEFDVFYEVNIAGVTHKVAIECKNHNRKCKERRFRSF